MYEIGLGLCFPMSVSADYMLCHNLLKVPIIHCCQYNLYTQYNIIPVHVYFIFQSSTIQIQPVSKC